MTDLLIVCLWISTSCFALTVGLLVIPIAPRERRLWRYLRVGALRRWVTRRRRVDEPFHEQLTVNIARTNLAWHLFLTGVFCWQIAWAVLSEGSWWRPLTIPLAAFCLAYCAGSLVQRQKIAIVRARQGQTAAARDRRR